MKRTIWIAGLAAVAIPLCAGFLLAQESQQKDPADAVEVELARAYGQVTLLELQHRTQHAAYKDYVDAYANGTIDPQHVRGIVSSALESFHSFRAEAHPSDLYSPSEDALVDLAVTQTLQNQRLIKQNDQIILLLQKIADGK